MAFNFIYYFFYFGVPCLQTEFFYIHFYLLLILFGVCYLSAFRGMEEVNVEAYCSCGNDVIIKVFHWLWKSMISEIVNDKGKCIKIETAKLVE